MDASASSEVLAEPRAEAIGEGITQFESTLAFPDGSRLSMLLIVNVSSGTPVWLHYSFHYMNAESECIFRYDSARHYTELPFFPHHKHEGPDEIVVGCPQPSVRAIRDEIEAYLKSAG